MKINLIHKKNFQFTAENNSGSMVMMDANKSIGGSEEGFRPMELLLISLASCASIDVVLILNKFKKPYSDYRVEIKGNRTKEIPAVFNAIDLCFSLKSDQISSEIFSRAVKLSLNKYCSVSKMLKTEVMISAKIQINEGERLKIFSR